MRCKKHLPDLSSTIGVCASCLRERLEPLVEAQAQAQAQSEAQSVRSAASDVDRHRRRKPEPNTNANVNVNASAINFPRSVSPYVSRRKTDCDLRREKLFYSTPQVGRDGGMASAKRRLGGRLWSLSNMFKARSNKAETAYGQSCEEPSSSASPPPTTSWFSAILHARGHNHGAVDRRQCKQPDRGVSAASVTENFSDALDGRDRSAAGCSVESSPMKQNPAAAASRKSRLGPGGKGLTSMAFCLNPLVRAGPNQHWSQKGLAQELSGAHHISNAPSFCANRSRKLADFGRVRHNR